MTEQGRILGVDLGFKRTGLAVSDERWITTRALPNLSPQSRAKDIEYLIQLCDEMDIQTVLIGYPVLPQSGDEGPMAKRARGFYEALCKATPPTLSVFLIEETYTSKEAASRLGAKKDALKLLDGESARILIETFIHAQNH
ncbi:MAG: Holliday junction resolvase RuvX [Myxococcota bacterium]